MTISAVPFALQNVPVNADVVRQAVSSLIPNGGGLVQTGDLAVTQLGTPAMGVQVGVGRAWIDGTNIAHLTGQGYGKQGMYFIMNDAASTVTIATSDATNPRIDVIYASVLDSQYAGGGDGAVLGVATGTPTAGASYPANAPAVPNNAIKLAWVYVGANVTTITTSNITAIATTTAFLSVTTIPLGSGFANITSDLLTAAKQGSFVTLTGFVNRTSGTGTTIGTLPAGYRPAMNTYGSIIAYGLSGSDGTHFRVKVLTTGDITLNALSGSTAWDANAWIPLNITFWTP